MDESFEFIELQNISGQPLNLAGVQFTQGVNVRARATDLLQPGEYALVVKDRAAFTARYGAAAAAKIVGDYPPDILDNGGERLRLEDAGRRGRARLPHRPGVVPQHRRRRAARSRSATRARRSGRGATRRRGDRAACQGGTPGAPDGVPTGVAGAWLFYNNSSFDGRDPAAGAADDAAVAAGKSGWDGTGPVSFAHVSGYSRGINGVMIDVSNLLAEPTAADFIVEMSQPGSATGWVAAPTPAVARRAGDGAGESDRVSLVWPDGSIVNRWLRVTLRDARPTG